MSEDTNQSEHISSRPLPSAEASKTNNEQAITFPIGHTELSHTSRRGFLTGAVVGGLTGAVVGGLGGWAALQRRQPLQRAAAPTQPVSVPATAKNALAMPGLYPGRVIEVAHPGSLGTAIKNGYTERNREAVKSMIGRGMKELTGADDAVSAWRAFFS